MGEKTEKHFIIELFERLEKSWLEHEGTHKLAIEGITIESPVKKGITKVFRISGNMEFDVKTKKK